VNETAFEPNHDSLGSVYHAQLAEDVLDVDLDRRFGS
jgi:hypothetical protein